MYMGISPTPWLSWPRKFGLDEMIRDDPRLVRRLPAAVNTPPRAAQVLVIDRDERHEAVPQYCREIA